MRLRRAGSNQSAKQAKQDGENEEPTKQRHEKTNQTERIRGRIVPAREAFSVQGRFADFGRRGIPLGLRRDGHGGALRERCAGHESIHVRPVR